MFLRFRMFLSMHKQVIVIAILSLITIALLIASIVLFIHLKKEVYDTTTFISVDEEFSITLDDRLGMDTVADSEYKLFLKTNTTNDTIAVSKTETNVVYSLEEIVTADKENYIAQFDDVTNASDISSGTINNYEYYEYSFDITDASIKVYWICANDCYYVFDFAYDNNSTIDLKSNTQAILESFVLL